MTKVVGTITTNLDALNKYRDSLGDINRKVFYKWAVRYRSFVQRRYDVYSRGGGDWPPLSAATIKRRKPAARRKNAVKGSAQPRQVSILRDTNTMFTALTPALVAPAGSVNQLLTDGTGIEVGFAGNATHPGGATIAQIALWHHVGAPPNPVRQIIVLPDRPTIQGMENDLSAAHSKALKDGGNTN